MLSRYEQGDGSRSAVDQLDFENREEESEEKREEQDDEGGTSQRT